MSSLPWERLWNGDEDVATPSMSGAAMSSSFEEGLWGG
jgi:hypothetical protein